MTVYPSKAKCQFQTENMSIIIEKAKLDARVIFKATSSQCFLGGLVMDKGKIIKALANAVYEMNMRKNLWLFKPMQLLIQGQWWSIIIMSLLQVLQ